MKIMCQEHYDKVVQYAESIGDKTLHECLKRLERGEQNPHHRAKSNFTKTLLRIHSFSKSAIPTGVWALSADWFIMAVRTARAVSSTSRFTVG